MKRLPRKTIERLLNEYDQVQLACSYSNSCRWHYLTTSGKVCREEFGFVEDTDFNDRAERIDLNMMTWSSVKRLQKALQNLSNS